MFSDVRTVKSAVGTSAPVLSLSHLTAQIKVQKLITIERIFAISNEVKRQMHRCRGFLDSVHTSCMSEVQIRYLEYVCMKRGRQLVHNRKRYRCQ